MTEPREKEEDASGELKQKSTRPPGRWNPFASLRMTISPDERMALLKLPRPLLPVEDFLTKEERKKLVSARRRPVIVRSAVLAGAAVLGALVWWLWPSVPQRDVQPEAAPPSVEPTVAISPPPIPARVATSVQPAAESSASSRPPLPAVSLPVASVHPSAKPPKREARGSTAEKPKPLAPDYSSSPAPHTPDFKTPW